MTWKAYVSDERLFVRGKASILLARPVGDGMHEFAAPDGNNLVISDSVTPDEGLAFVVPYDALPAIAEALAKHLGDSLPSVGEIKVLREWLEVERLRTDAALLQARVTGTP